MEKISKTHLKELLKLKQKKYRELSGKSLVEGLRLIKQLVQNEIRISELFTTNPALNTKEFPADRYQLLEDWELAKLAYTANPQELIAVVNSDFPRIIKDDLLIYLENIKEPGNLGAIFRTALAAGTDGIILSPDCCERTNPKVIRSSLGAVFSLPSEIKPVSWLLQQNASLLCTTSHQAEDIYRFTPPLGRKILIFGSEAEGVSKEITDSSSFHLKIPLHPQMESLNVAVAAGICIYHFCYVR